MSKLLDRVTRNEGFRPKPYQDTLGVWTIGHGLTFLKPEESRAIVCSRLMRIEERLLKSKPWIAKCDRVAIEIVIEMVFQMGARKAYRFRRMFTALKVGEYRDAAAEMRDSRWHKQTPNRCERMAKRMEQIR